MIKTVTPNNPGEMRQLEMGLEPVTFCSLV